MKVFPSFFELPCTSALQNMKGTSDIDGSAVDTVKQPAIQQSATEHQSSVRFSDLLVINVVKHASIVY
jgi:hypothetical protein